MTTDGNDSRQLDELAACAQEMGCQLGFQFMPHDGGDEPPVLHAVYVSLTAGDERATIRVYDPEDGHQITGLLFREDAWASLVNDPSDERVDR